MRGPTRGPRLAASVLWMVSSGCTTLREIPRAQYAAVEERQHVAVETGEGRRYEFDFARFGSDTLIGYRQRNREGAFEEYDSVPIALESVARLSARRVDWYRTGLIGGAALAAIIAVALARRGNSAPEPVTPRCTEEPCP